MTAPTQANPLRNPLQHKAQTAAQQPLRHRLKAQTQPSKAVQVQRKKKSTTKKAKKTTAPADSDNKSPITVNQALDILDNDFYGKGYQVNATVKEGGYQYFSVYDKNGNKYASVKVDLSTADAVETLTNSSGAPNTFNLYSIS